MAMTEPAPHDDGAAVGVAAAGDGRSGPGESAIPYATPVRPALGPRELFGVVVRTAGLILSLWGVYTFFYATAAVILRFNPSYANPTTVLFGVGYLLAGLALLKGEWVLNFAYGPPL